MMKRLAWFSFWLLVAWLLATAALPVTAADQPTPAPSPSPTPTAPVTAAPTPATIEPAPVQPAAPTATITLHVTGFRSDLGLVRVARALPR